MKEWWEKKNEIEKNRIKHEKKLKKQYNKNKEKEEQQGLDKWQ